MVHQGVPHEVSIAVGVAVGLMYLWGLWYIGRRTKSWAYAERTDDLIVTRGFMFKRLVIVPYGRMQLVDLAAGPVDRAFGIAKLQLHTAAATTDASIPGLTPDIAAALRDRLAELGEQRAANAMSVPRAPLSNDAATAPQRLHPLSPIATTLPFISGIFFLTLVINGGAAEARSARNSAWARSLHRWICHLRDLSLSVVDAVRILV